MHRFLSPASTPTKKSAPQQLAPGGSATESESDDDESESEEEEEVFKSSAELAGRNHASSDDLMPGMHKLTQQLKKAASGYTGKSDHGLFMILCVSP
jgi:hypothetical protein